jgi:hypothetical protein
MGAVKNKLIAEMEETGYDDFSDMECSIALQQELNRTSFWGYVINFFRRTVCK